MSWEEIKAKITSRKFWMMVITFIGLICVALNIEALTTEKIIGVVSSFSILVIYMIGETFTDIANRKLNPGEVVVVNVALKLTSRKFWAALVSFVTTLLITLGVDMLTVDHVETMIMAIATVAIYILGESAVDVSKIRAELNHSLQEIEEEKEELIDNVTQQVVVPVDDIVWLSMYVFAFNKIAATIYTEPNATAEYACGELSHLTEVHVEPDTSYGEEGRFSKIVIGKDTTKEYYIISGELVDQYANADTPIVTDDSPVVVEGEDMVEETEENVEEVVDETDEAFTE